MAIEEFASQDSTWQQGTYMIFQFDPRNAELTKFGDTYVLSDHNLAEARRDAQRYAEEAAEKGLPLQFIVATVMVDTGYRPKR